MDLAGTCGSAQGSAETRCRAVPTLLLLQQILLLLVSGGLGGLYLRGQLGVNVVAVADVVHAAAAARDDPLHLLGLLGFRGLVPVWGQAGGPRSQHHSGDPIRGFGAAASSRSRTRTCRELPAPPASGSPAGAARWAAPPAVPVVVLTMPPTACPLSISSCTESRLRCRCSSIFFT